MREPRHISSRAHALVKTLHRLATEPAASRRLGQVWLEGDHLARAFLARGGRAALAVVGASAWLQPGPRELALQAAEIVVIDDALLPEISSLESPAPIGFLIDLPSSGQQPLPGVATVVLDRLQDPGNVGTILRSAAALGVRQVLAMKGSAALWSPKVLRAGMGAHFALHLVEALAPDDLDALAVPLAISVRSQAASASCERPSSTCRSNWPANFATIGSSRSRTPRMAGSTKRRSGFCLASRAAAPSRAGAMWRTSPRRLPGSSAITRASSGRPSAVRAASRGTSSGIASASGWPT